MMSRAVRISIDNDVINHTQTPYVCVMNAHVGAGFDRGSDRIAVLVHNVTRPFEHNNPEYSNGPSEQRDFLTQILH